MKLISLKQVHISYRPFYSSYSFTITSSRHLINMYVYICMHLTFRMLPLDEQFFDCLFSGSKHSVSAEQASGGMAQSLSDVIEDNETAKQNTSQLLRCVLENIVSKLHGYYNVNQAYITCQNNYILKHNKLLEIKKDKHSMWDIFSGKVRITYMQFVENKTITHMESTCKPHIHFFVCM